MNETSKTDFRIFLGSEHSSESAIVDKWYFEPEDYDGDLFSDPYDFEAQAIAAAEAWAVQDTADREHEAAEQTEIAAAIEARDAHGPAGTAEALNEYARRQL